MVFLWVVLKKNIFFSLIVVSCNIKSYRFGAEFGGENVAYGCEQHHVKLLGQGEEVAEGENNHFFRVSIQPLSYLH